MSEQEQGLRHVLDALEAYQRIERYTVSDTEVTFQLDRHHGDVIVHVDLKTGDVTDDVTDDFED